MTSMKDSKGSHIVVDLGCRNSGPALAALTIMKQRSRKVRSAVVIRPYGTCTEYDVRNSNSRFELLSIFRALGELPHLASLAVDLGDLFLPIDAVVTLLRAAKALKALKLHNLTISGTDMHDHLDLENTLAGHPSLQSINLMHCRGTDAVRLLLTKPASLHKIRITNSLLSRNEVWAGLSLTQICSIHPELQVLALRDVPNMGDKEIDLITQALDFESCKLRTLSITSEEAGHKAGEAIVQLLLKNKTISELALNLGRSWSDCGCSMANVLANNVVLTKATLRIGGNRNDVVRSMVQIANALKDSRSTRLAQLHLRVDLTDLREGGQDQAILKLFDSVLEENNVLQELRIIDEHVAFEELPLPSSLLLKLNLNRSGIPRLLHENNGQPPVEPYLQAIAASSEDINICFLALINSPGLFCGVEQGVQKHPLCHGKHKYSVAFSSSYSKFKKSYSSTAWRRRVRSLLSHPALMLDKATSSYYAKSA